MHTSHDIFTMQQVTNANSLCMVVVWGMETGLGPGPSVRIHARVSAKYNIDFTSCCISESYYISSSIHVFAVSNIATLLL